MQITNPFDSKNIIWYIQDVSTYEIKVHFPDSRRLQRFIHHGQSFHGGIVGSYVVIEWESKGFVGKFIKVALPEKERRELSEENYKNTEFHPVWYVELLFAFDLLSFEPEKSINNFPSVGSKVYITNSEFYISLLNTVKNNYPEDALDIGEDLDTNEHISLSANKIFQRHCAIVGTTWGGKSYTISKIIEELIKKEWAKIVLLDATGEFSSLDDIIINWVKIWKKWVFVDWDDPICFHYQDLPFEDICALFRPSWQSQLPLLENALKILSSIWKLKEKYENNTTNFPQYNEVEVFYKPNQLKSDFNKIIWVARIEEYDIKGLVPQLYYSAVYDNNRDDKNKFWGIDDKAASYLQSLIFRVQTLLSDKDADNVFNFSNKGTKTTVHTLLLNFLKPESKEKVLRLDLSNIPEIWDLRSILVNAIWRFFLTTAKKGDFRYKPLIIFLDEAHLFLWKKIKDEYSIEVELNAFERIAKECRKYGLYLCISTQRPRDIPEWILSQMGTFIVHRLINESDKKAIENAVSNYNKSFLNFLPSLWKWEALIMWVEFLTTIFLRIQKTLYEPNSHTPPLFDTHSNT
jgi:hypothetical protein